MSDPESLPNQALRFRVAELEARVDRLEQSLAVLAAQKGDGGSVMRDPATAAITVAERSLMRTARLAALGAVSPGGPPGVQGLAEPAPPAKKPTDILGITDAFSTLDSTLAEAHQSESALPHRMQRGTGLQEIDEAIVDRHLERPPPQKLDVRAALETSFPKILQRVVDGWRTPELRAYLSKLIVDDRGDRAGFDPNVMSDLLMLNAVLDAAPDAGAWTGQARVV